MCEVVLIVQNGIFQEEGKERGRDGGRWKDEWMDEWINGLLLDILN